MSETITWDPQLFGVSILGLEEKRLMRQPAYRVLRYSIQMQLRKVETIYWIKAYALKKKSAKTAIPMLSKPIRRDAILQDGEMSLNLSESFRFGKGLARATGPTRNLNYSFEREEKTQPDSGPSASNNTTSSRPSQPRPELDPGQYGQPDHHWTELAPSSFYGRSAPSRVEAPSSPSAQELDPSVDMAEDSLANKSLLPRKRPASREGYRTFLGGLFQ